YVFRGMESKACKDGLKIHCVDYVDGKAVGKIDYTDKNAKTQKTTLKMEFKPDLLGLSKLLGLGFENNGETSLEKTETLDLAIGIVEFPGKCGEVCIRRQEITMSWNKWLHQSSGKSYIVDVMYLDVPVGWCLGANLHDCDTKKAGDK